MHEEHNEACNPMSMVDWINSEEPQPEDEDGDGVCFPCTLPLMTNLYQDILKKNGQPKLARKLGKLRKADNLTPIQVAEELDRIKEVTPILVSQALRDLDCEVQRELSTPDE